MLNFFLLYKYTITNFEKSSIVPVIFCCDGGSVLWLRHMCVSHVQNRSHMRFAARMLICSRKGLSHLLYIVFIRSLKFRIVFFGYLSRNQVLETRVDHLNNKIILQFKIIFRRTSGQKTQFNLIKCRTYLVFGTSLSYKCIVFHSSLGV